MTMKPIESLDDLLAAVKGCMVVSIEMPNFKGNQNPASGVVQLQDRAPMRLVLTLETPQEVQWQLAVQAVLVQEDDGLAVEIAPALGIQAIQL